MFTFDAENFRILRKVSIRDPGRVSVFVGKNQQGKSSIAQGIKFAFTGEAYGRRGAEVLGLVTHGQTRLKVKAVIGDQSASRTTSGGDKISDVAGRLGVPTAVLPLLFDGETVGDGGNAHMKAFLSGAGSARFDAKVHFASDASMLYYLNQAITAGSLTTKAQIAFCEARRAAQKAPPEPVRPATENPSQALLDQAKAQADAARAAEAEEISNIAGIDALARGLAIVAQHLAAHENWEKLKATSAVGDTLTPEKRNALESLLHANPGTLAALERLADAAGFGGAPFATTRGYLEELVNHAKTELAAHPRPTPLPAEPALAADCEGLAGELRSAESLTREGVALHLTNTQATQASRRSILDGLKNARAAAEDRLGQFLRAAGAWSAYHAAEPQWAENKAKTEEEWKRWDTAARNIKQAEAEYLETVGNEFATRANTYAASLLNGRQIQIDVTEGITLGGDRMTDLSKSERWCVEACVMAAIARVSKSPLLLLDGADVLDREGRDALATLLIHSLSLEFAHTIVLSTAPNGIENEFQYGPEFNGQVTKWIVANGDVTLAPSA